MSSFGPTASPRSIGAAVALFAALLAAPTGVHAFSDPALFGQAAVQGGGAGRQFTGSPVDGFSCSVCHVPAGRTPEVRIEGLPDRYEPGRSYDLRLSWDGDESHALQLELATKQGVHAALELPDAGELDASARCDGDPEADPAVYTVELDPRRVIGVSDCGASALELRFTAPDAEYLYFAFGLVRSDRQGDAAGDGVLEVRRLLTSVEAPDSGAGCSAAGHPASGSPGGAVWVALGLLLWLRRARPRTALAALVATLFGCSEVPVDASPGDGVDAAYLIDRFTPDAAMLDCPAQDRALTFSVRTTSVGGRWAPRNVGAIWIEDAEGNFVKTLERWSTVRTKYLLGFLAASDNDVFDAITSATLNKHQTHEALWDLGDRTQCEVPDGAYRLLIELTDQNRAGTSLAIDFDKSAEPFVLTPEDADSFHDMRLQLD